MGHRQHATSGRRRHQRPCRSASGRTVAVYENTGTVSGGAAPPPSGSGRNPDRVRSLFPAATRRDRARHGEGRPSARPSRWTDRFGFMARLPYIIPSMPPMLPGPAPAFSAQRQLREPWAAGRL